MFIQYNDVVCCALHPCLVDQLAKLFAIFAVAVKLLSEWEEPELTKTKKSQATVRDLVIFKKTVNCMDDKYPFGRAFGHVSIVLLATMHFSLSPFFLRRCTINICI